MFKPEYIMFFDNHTHRQCPDVGKDFNAAEFADSLKEAGIDLIGFHAKCNQGFCYYDTKIGIRHPSLGERDLFGEVVQACTERGIRVTAYFNAGLSNETAVEHPEWGQINPAGSFFHTDIEGTDITPYMRIMCVNSPWRDQLKSMVREVLEKYPVSGFLFDGLNGFPCRCAHCVKEMHALGLNPLDEKELENFGKRSAVRLAEELSELVEPQKRGMMFNCLGIGASANARIGTYLECECLPTVPCWGYDWLPVFSRYYRCVSNHGLVLNMTGRFYDWGDFGTLRTDAAIEYDLFYGLSQGMRPNVGDHFYPRGNQNKAVIEAVGRIYRKIRKFEPWYQDASNPVDLAVLFPQGEWKESLCGAVRMLSELQVQFDIVDMKIDWSPYKVLLLPDKITFDSEGAAKLQEFLNSGGKIIATGNSGLDSEGNAYCCEKEWGAEFLGESEINPPYFRLNSKYAELFPDLPLGINAGGYEVRSKAAKNTAGCIVKPYYNKGWNGFDSMYYTPPDALSDVPFLILGEQVSLCPWRIFEGYYTAATPDMRKILKLMLDNVLPERLLKPDATLPSFGRMAVTDQAQCRNVHLFNYLPEARGKMLIVDEIFTLKDIIVKVKTDGRKVDQVIIAPDSKAIPFTEENGYAVFTVPEVSGYALASVKFK